MGQLEELALQSQVAPPQGGNEGQGGQGGERVDAEELG